MAIRENIIKLREMNQITQEQLAEIAGVSRGAVSQWEGGFSEPRMGQSNVWLTTSISPRAILLKTAEWTFVTAQVFLEP